MVVPPTLTRWAAGRLALFGDSAGASDMWPGVWGGTGPLDFTGYRDVSLNARAMLEAEFGAVLGLYDAPLTGLGQRQSACSHRLSYVTFAYLHNCIDCTSHHLGVTCTWRRIGDALVHKTYTLGPRVRTTFSPAAAAREAVPSRWAGEPRSCERQSNMTQHCCYHHVARLAHALKQGMRHTDATRCMQHLLLICCKQHA